MQPVDDAEAVRLTKSGDSRGAEALVNRYQMSVYNSSLRMLGNPADAEDAAQDVFLKAFQRVHQYRPEEPFGAWLRGITRHHCLDLLRRRRPMPEAAETAVLDTEAAALASLERNQVRTALDRLAGRERALLVLRYWEDESIEGIARAMGMSEGAAKVALLRARRALGKILAPSEVKADAV